MLAAQVVRSLLTCYTNSMMTTEELIAVTYTNWIGRSGQVWMRIQELAGLVGRDDLNETISRLIREYDDFRAEPEPFNHRLTAWERENCPVLGGEQRHLICWG